MRKQVFGRKFKRTKNQRKALFSGLISAMILKGKISTTYEKAKAIRPDLEKMVTKAKKDESSARRLLQSDLKPHEIDIMVTQIGPGFKNRAGGFTRMVKTGKRFNDDATMVIMEWSEMEAVVVPVKIAKPKKEKAEVKKSPEKKSLTKTVKKAASKVTKKETK